MWAQIAAAVVGAGLSYASAKKLQKEQYTDLRKSAERAGFNPLTVLRAGGGYTAVPHMSKYAAFGQALEGIFDAYQNRHVDKYNKAIQDLELKQKQAELDLTPLRGKLMKAQIQSMKGEVDSYIGYEKFIPVKVGVNEQYLQIDVAKRLGILPNTPITAGDLEEIKGEIHGGFESAVGSKIGTEVLKNAPIFGNNASIETTELPALGKNNLDQLLEDIAPIIGVKKGRNRPRVRAN
jgi:hypothetical protein